MTPDKYLNVTAGMRFINEFDEQNVYSLNDAVSESDKHIAAEEHYGKILFSEPVSYKKLASLINQGAEIKHTKISDAFSFDDYQSQYKNSHLLPLFVVDARNNVRIFSTSNQPEIAPGSTVVALVNNQWA